MAMLEAIHALEPPRAAWLEPLPSITDNAFRDAIGISAVLYRTGGAAIHVDAVAGIDVDDEWLRLSRAVHAAPGIAYELGLAHATVRALSGTHGGKFRVRNRAALITRFLQHQTTAAPR